MGMVLGKITVETPKHEVLHTGAGYEVRRYPPCVAAEYTYDPKEWKGVPDGGFTVLANYIGALGKPQNTKPEKIAMTAPVITTGGEGKSAEKIAMTAPVITTGAGGEPEPVAMTAPVITDGQQAPGKVTMQFLLPSKYTKAEEAPHPTDERVVIREVPERKFGVVRFSGVARGHGQGGEGEGGGAQGRTGDGRVHHHGPVRAGAVQPAVHAPAAAHQRGHDPRRVIRPPHSLPPYRPASGVQWIECSTFKGSEAVSVILCCLTSLFSCNGCKLCFTTTNNGELATLRSIHRY